MHATTTTQCSDVLQSLRELNAYMDEQCSNYCHKAEGLELIISGIVLIEQIQSSTPPELFDDEEQEFIFDTNNRLHGELVTIMT